MRRTKESVPPGDEARGGNWFQMKQEVGRADKETAVWDRGNGGRGQSLDTHTQPESKFKACASKQKIRIASISYSLLLSFFFFFLFYIFPPIPSWLSSSPCCLDTPFPSLHWSIHGDHISVWSLCPSPKPHSHKDLNYTSKCFWINGPLSVCLYKLCVNLPSMLLSV